MEKFAFKSLQMLDILCQKNILKLEGNQATREPTFFLPLPRLLYQKRMSVGGCTVADNQSPLVL
jgi:hypothetical protein